MSEISIPKDRYDHLLKCEKMVESEFNEKFSKEFMKDVEKSIDDYKKGRFVEVNGSAQRKKLFDSL